MEEKATIYDLWRICRRYDVDCSSCPLYHKDCRVGVNVSIEKIDEMNEIILKWCKEHPVKTRQDKFLEHYPNTKTCYGGVIDVCPYVIENGKYEDWWDCESKDCIKCKTSYWLAEVEE